MEMPVSAWPFASSAVVPIGMNRLPTSSLALTMTDLRTVPELPVSRVPVDVKVLVVLPLLPPPLLPPPRS
jgi:hypothetical protein